MNILVPGGAGFIGSHIVDRLIEQNHRVVVVDDLSTGFRSNVNPKATFYESSILSPELHHIFEKERPQIIYHLAAQMDVRKSVEDPTFDAKTNILGSINLIALATKARIKKFIYASTGGAVYGEPKKLPVNEDHPVNPVSQYGISKHTVEHYLYLYQTLYGLTYSVMRLANIYGPRQNPHGEAGVTAIFFEQLHTGKTPTIFGDGTKTRDYVYVQDVVDLAMILLEKGHNAIYNVGWGIEVSDYEIFKAVRDALKLTGEPNYSQKRLGEIDRIALDPSKAKTDLNWSPKVPLQEGITHMITFNLQH